MPTCLHALGYISKWKKFNQSALNKTRKKKEFKEKLYRSSFFASPTNAIRPSRNRLLCLETFFIPIHL